MLLLQAAFTSSFYKQLLQAAFTSSFYKQLLQAAFTSSFYKQLLQEAFMQITKAQKDTDDLSVIFHF